jgi:hypothetical protein
VFLSVNLNLLLKSSDDTVFPGGPRIGHRSLYPLMHVEYSRPMLYVRYHAADLWLLNNTTYKKYTLVSIGKESGSNMARRCGKRKMPPREFIVWACTSYTDEISKPSSWRLFEMWLQRTSFDLDCPLRSLGHKGRHRRIEVTEKDLLNILS